MATSIILWSGITISIAALAVPTYYLLRRFLNRRQAQRFARAVTMAHNIFEGLKPIPDILIQRDLRRGLVLLLSSQLAVIRQHNPGHPHLHFLQEQVARFNRIPTGFQRGSLRSKAERRAASNAFADLADLLQEGIAQGAVDQRNGSLALASARCASQQIAVETARQAAKDAENVRAYPQALDFAYQAQALCRKLPPIMQEKFTQAVSEDIDRLKNLGNAPIRT